MAILINVEQEWIDSVVSRDIILESPPAKDLTTIDDLVKGIFNAKRGRKRGRDIWLQINCSNCAEPFERKKSSDKHIKGEERFCSNQCHYNFKREAFVCDNCAIVGIRNKSRLAITKYNFCNNACRGKFVSEMGKKYRNYV